tara:strand:- start:64 stop:5166 length:5103 start_codon:yes stop_codon:yes gene_type:complete
MSENFLNIPDPIEPPADDEDTKGIPEALQQQMQKLVAGMSPLTAEERIEKEKEREKQYDQYGKAIAETGERLAKRVAKKASTTIFASPDQQLPADVRQTIANRPGIGIGTTIAESKAERKLAAAEAKGKAEQVEKDPDAYKAISRGAIPFGGAGPSVDADGNYVERSVVSDESIIGVGLRQIAEGGRAFGGGEAASVFKKQTDATRGGGLSTFEMIGGFAVDALDFVFREIEGATSLLFATGVPDDVDHPFFSKGGLFNFSGPYYRSSDIYTYGTRRDKDGKRVQFKTQFKEGGLPKLYTDIANVYGIGVDRYNQYTSATSKAFEKSFKDVAGKSPSLFYDDLRRRYVEVPYMYQNEYTKAAARVGMNAPWAGLGAVSVGGQIVFRNLARGVLASKIVFKTKAYDAFRNMPFRQIMTDRSVQTGVMPHQMLDIIEKYDLDADKYIKAYRARGMSPEAAIAYRRRLHAAYLGSIGGATGMGVMEQIFEDSPVALVIGAIGGYLGAQPIYTKLSRGLAKGAIKGPLQRISSLSFMKHAMPITDFVEIMAKSSSKSLSVFRRSYLIAHGYDMAQIKSLMDKGRKTGEVTIQAIKKAESSVEKQNLLLKAQNEHVLGPEAKIVDGKLVNAKINPYSELVPLLKTDAKTMNLVAGFKDYIDSIEIKTSRGTVDVKATEEAKRDMRSAMGSAFSKIDELTEANPELMKDFPVLLDQMIQSATLHTLRGQLIRAAEYSVMSKGFLAGGIMSQLEEFNKLQLQQTETLKKLMESFKGKGGQAPDEIQKAIRIVQEELVDNFITVNKENFLALKTLSEQPFMRRKARLVEKQRRMEREMGFDRDVFDEAQIGERAALAFDNALESAKTRTDKAYASFKTQYGNNPNYRVNIGDVLTEPLREGELPSITNLANKFGISPALAKRIEKDASTTTLELALKGKTPKEQYDYLKKQVEINAGNSSRRADGSMDVELLNTTVKENLSTVVIDPSTNAVRPLEDQIDILKRQLAASDTAAKTLSVNNYMDLMQALNKNLAMSYRGGLASGNFAQYNAIRERKERLLETFEDSFNENDSIIEASKIPGQVFREAQGPFRDLNSPLRKIKIQQDNLTTAAIDKHEYFNLFLQNAPFENAKYFRSAFLNKETNQYDPEAIASLKRAIGSLLMGGRSKEKRITGMDPIKDARTYEDITKTTENLNVEALNRQVLQPYRDILEEAGEGDFVEYLDDFVKHFDNPSRLELKREGEVVTLLNGAFDNLEETIKERLRNSVSVQFANTTESIDPSWIEFSGKKVQRSMKDIVDMLFANDAGASMARMAGGGAEGFIQSMMLGKQERAAELFAKRKKGALHLDDDMGKAATPDELKVLNHLNNNELKNILNSIAPAGDPRQPSTPFIRILLDEVEELAGKEKAESVRESLQTLFIDEWMKRSFPPVKKVVKEYHALPLIRQNLINKMVKDGLAGDVDQAVHKINFRDPDAIAYMRQNDPNFNAKNYEEYEFNMGYELDMIGAGLFLRDNKQAFKELFDEEQVKQFETYTEVINMISAQLDNVDINNIPRGYTTAMLLGRVYNAMKGVVSPRYLIGEKLIMDYRLNQANLLREVLTDKNTSKAIINVFRNDVAFNKAEIRKAARSIVIHAAAAGIKTKNMDEYAKDLEKIAIAVRQNVSDKDKQQEQFQADQTVTSGPLSRITGMNLPTAGTTNPATDGLEPLRF